MEHPPFKVDSVILDLRINQPQEPAKRSIRSWNPQFLIQWEPRYAAWWENLAVICRGRAPAWVPRLCPFASGWPSPRSPHRRVALLSSILMHVGGLTFILFFPFSRYFPPPPKTPNSRLIADLQRTHSIIYVPVLRPRGPGGTPGRGTEKSLPPRAGSTGRNPIATIISNPPRPDNLRQTIQQAASPPELKFPVEMRLPNLLLTNNTVAPIAPPKVAVRITKAVEVPKRPEPRAPAAPARPVEVPRPVPISPELNLAALAPISNPSPRLPVPPTPVRITRAAVEVAQQTEPKTPPVPSAPAEVPRPVPISPGLNLDLLAAISNASPRSPVPAPPMPELVNVDVGAGQNIVGGVVGGIVDTLIISVDPGPLPFPAELPAGNRAGSFSIAGSASGAGAVGGTADGNPVGGIGGPGDGGNPSVGLGPGTSGGGGGATAATGIVSMDGKGDAKSGNGIIVVLPDSVPVLPDSVPPNWIYPVTSLPATPRSGIVVSTGPVGGGGLGVYGVLRGGRISTTYLPMPYKNWILQYSPIPEASSASNRTPTQAVVTLRDNLTPPWPEKKFDFRRPPIPSERSNRMIILHGRIREDGTVEELKVHQGVQTDADQIALAAFRQWVFRPATRGGKPIPVEILVGIPASVPKETL